jgi:hypothetical protein
MSTITNSLNFIHSNNFTLIATLEQAKLIYAQKIAENAILTITNDCFRKLCQLSGIDKVIENNQKNDAIQQTRQPIKFKYIPNLSFRNTMFKYAETVCNQVGAVFKRDYFEQDKKLSKNFAKVYLTLAQSKDKSVKNYSIEKFVDNLQIGSFPIFCTNDRPDYLFKTFVFPRREEQLRSKLILPSNCALCVITGEANQDLTKHVCKNCKQDSCLILNMTNDYIEHNPAKKLDVFDYSYGYYDRTMHKYIYDKYTSSESTEEYIGSEELNSDSDNELVDKYSLESDSIKERITEKYKGKPILEKTLKDAEYYININNMSSFEKNLSEHNLYLMITYDESFGKKTSLKLLDKVQDIIDSDDINVRISNCDRGFHRIIYLVIHKSTKSKIKEIDIPGVELLDGCKDYRIYVAHTDDKCSKITDSSSRLKRFIINSMVVRLRIWQFELKNYLGSDWKEVEDIEQHYNELEYYYAFLSKLTTLYPEYQDKVECEVVGYYEKGMLKQLIPFPDYFKYILI